MIGDKLGFRGADVRDRGKRADLAFGFGGSVAAFRNFAPEGDTSTDEQIRAWRNAWRRQHPRTTQFWYDIERAAVAAVISRTPQTYGRFTLRFEAWRGVPFLWIELPSKRRLAYPYAKLITNDYGSTAVSFMDNAIVTGGWSEYRPGRGMWGGGFTENLTQAVARDLLAAAMLRLEATNNPVVLHVHDSIVCEVPDGIAV
jgi:DNA polymerase